MLRFSQKRRNIPYNSLLINVSLSEIASHCTDNYVRSDSMTNDRRLIEDFLSINSVGEATSSDPRTKGHISTLHVWRARRPLVACCATVYGALLPASWFIPENGPDNRKQSLGRANAVNFIKRLCAGLARRYLSFR